MHGQYRHMSMSICGDQTPAWYYQATLWSENNNRGLTKIVQRVEHTALNGEDMMAIVLKKQVGGCFNSACGDGTGIGEAVRGVSR